MASRLKAFMLMTLFALALAMQFLCVADLPSPNLMHASHACQRIVAIAHAVGGQAYRPASSKQRVRTDRIMKRIVSPDSEIRFATGLALQHQPLWERTPGSPYPDSSIRPPC